MHRLARPVPLRPRKVGGGPPVQRGQRKHLGRREAVELSTACPREQVLEPVPVVPPKGYEVLSSQC